MDRKGGRLTNNRVKAISILDKSIKDGRVEEIPKIFSVKHWILHKPNMGPLTNFYFWCIMTIVVVTPTFFALWENFFFFLCSFLL